MSFWSTITGCSTAVFGLAFVAGSDEPCAAGIGPLLTYAKVAGDS